MEHALVFIEVFHKGYYATLIEELLFLLGVSVFQCDFYTSVQKCLFSQSLSECFEGELHFLKNGVIGPESDLGPGFSCITSPHDLGDGDTLFVALGVYPAISVYPSI